MTINEFQLDVLRTESGSSHKYPRILHGMMGLCGEAGEAMDILKKTMYQHHPLDKEHLALELGDVAYYLALAADSIGYDLETLLTMNVTKRQIRYPNGFDSERSINREAGDI